MSEEMKSKMKMQQNRIHFLEQQLDKKSQHVTRIPQITSSEIDSNMKLTVERTYQCDTKTKMGLLCKIEV